MNNKVKVGSIELNSIVALAPMAGITDSPFRQIIRSFSKNCLLVTEMLSSEALMWQKEQVITQKEEFEDPIVYQIAGHKPEMMAKAAQKVEPLATFIDINMGCPVNKIVKSNDGSGLMRTPDLAYEIVKAVKSAVNCPVSVKMRLGWDCNSKNFVEFGQLMCEAGVDMLTLHARTRSQQYSGKADWNAIKELKSSVEVPVFANGDIVSVEGAIECKNLTNCDGFMIGRGILGNPELIYRIEHYFETGEILPEKNLAQKVEILKEHIEKECEYRGEQNAIKYMRKFYSHYIKGVQNAAEYRNLLVQELDKIKVFTLLDEIVKNG